MSHLNHGVRRVAEHGNGDAADGVGRDRTDGEPTARAARFVQFVSALGASVGMLVAGPSPTGGAAVDTVLVVGVGLAATWCAATAPWWALLAAGGVAAATSPSALVAVPAIVASLLAVIAAVRPRWAHLVAAPAMAMLLQTLIRLGDLEFVGLTALIGVAATSFVAVIGLRSRPRRSRRIAGVAGLGALVIGLLAIALGVRAGEASRREIDEASDLAAAGVELLADGDIDGARVRFERAADRFASSRDRLDAVWLAPLRLVPIAAQYHRAATDLTDAFADVTSDVAQSLGVIDIDSIRVREGRVDLDAVRSLEEPLETIRTSFDSLDRRLAAAKGPWIADGLIDRLDRVNEEVDRSRELGDRVLAAVRAAPRFLGEDAPRVYFLAFTTPVEVRGLGGFMGNWAEITVDGGRIEVTDFGRHTDLNARGDPDRRRVDGPADFLAQYGDFGFRTASGGTRDNIWSDITMSPHFPFVADVVAQLYPQSGGDQLDGVFALDVYSLVALMQFVGNIDIPDQGITLTPETAGAFLLQRQYELIEDVPERVDALEIVARTTVDRLLDGALPSVADLADVMIPFVGQGRVVGWSAHAEEQVLFETFGLDGGLPELDGRDGIGLALNNAGNSKIDFFLDGDITYRVSSGSSGASSTVTIDLTNGAPSNGLPRYVIGNSYGLPNGTSRLYVSVYSAVPFSRARVDGKPIGMELGREAGWSVASAFIEVAPGASLRLEVDFDDVPPSSGGIVLHVPPTVRTLPATVLVDGIQRGSRIFDAGDYVR
jgi:hypothetical protein